MILDVLAFAAHPDDTELSCAGTLAKLVKQGLRVGVVDLTRGEMGTRGTPELRIKEAEAAAKILGLSVRENLGLPDTRLTNTREHQLAVIRAVRTYRPHICFITSPNDRHPDHGDATRLLQDSLFYSGLKKIETRDTKGPQQPHRPFHILHYIQDTPFSPDFVFDITDTIGIKEKAIQAFASQFNVADPGDEPETYISDPQFFESLRAKAMFTGHLGGFKYGEGFLYQKKPFGIQSLDFLLESTPKR